MIKLDKVRELRLDMKTTPSRPDYVYAASGLVRHEEKLLVVADDELHLAVFDFHNEGPGTLLRLLPGTLPDDYQARKKAKPNLESITLLPPYEYAPHGALLVVPSMSRRNRIDGLMMLLDRQQLSNSQFVPLDFTQIRAKLASMVKELNVEGIVIGKKAVKLFHRGSKNKSRSTVFELNADQFLKDMHDSHIISGDHIQNHIEYDLGDIDGVALQFTDAVALSDDRVLFLATAENTDNAYEDGATSGSALGIIGSDGRIEYVAKIEGTEKLEGVSVTINSSHIELLLVADTDDQSKPSSLFKTTISN